VSGTASRNELEKVPHEEPLLSLEDKFSSGEVANWYSNGGFLGMKLGSPAFDVEMKVDGLSVALEYVNGVFTIGSTRGDGRIGENVTENIKQVKGIPFDLRKKLKAIDPEFNAETVLRVRVEVVMLNRDFEKVNKERELNGEPLYANPRNAAAGTLRVLDPELVKKRGLTAIAFAVLHAEGFDGLNGDIKPGRTQLDDLAFLESLDFTVVPRYKADNPTDFDRAIEQIQNDRNDMPYWIDGAVIKVNSISAQNELGATSKYPRWAVAYKYKPEEKTTYVKQVIVQTGRTGILTPKVEFEPVSLGGTTVQYATLHNPGQIRELGGIAVGDEIVVSKAAEIIPQVVKVNTGSASRTQSCLR
jgi:DNA ligase (NAD+)